MENLLRKAIEELKEKIKEKESELEKNKIDSKTLEDELFNNFKNDKEKKVVKLLDGYGDAHITIELPNKESNIDGYSKNAIDPIHYMSTIAKSLSEINKLTSNKLDEVTFENENENENEKLKLDKKFFWR